MFVSLKKIQTFHNCVYKRLSASFYFYCWFSWHWSCFNWSKIFHRCWNRGGWAACFLENKVNFHIFVSKSLIWKLIHYPSKIDHFHLLTWLEKFSWIVIKEAAHIMLNFCVLLMTLWLLFNLSKFFIYVLMFILCHSFCCIRQLIDHLVCHFIPLRKIKSAKLKLSFFNSFMTEAVII